MNDLEIPILKKSFELYKALHECKRLIPKHDRFTIYVRSEELLLNIIELLIEAGYAQKTDRAVILEKVSVKLNILRNFIRLMKEVKTFDAKKYVHFQELVDEIGRMLGGWIKSTGLLFRQKTSV